LTSSSFKDSVMTKAAMLPQASIEIDIGDCLRTNEHNS
jgi:hypothetical protein